MNSGIEQLFTNVLVFKEKLARTIWQTTGNLLKFKEQEEILQKRIYLRRLPDGLNQLIDESLTFIKPALMNDVIDNDRRACLASKCSKTITQYKFDLMALNLDALEQTIRGHEQTLKDLQLKLFQICHDTMIQAIEKRQNLMRERHVVYLQYKLQTFFDEAPTTVNE